MINLENSASMHSPESKMMRREYIAPKVECVKLDNEISLQLESDPPVGPGESRVAPDYFNNDPFKMA